MNVIDSSPQSLPSFSTLLMRSEADHRTAMMARHPQLFLIMKATRLCNLRCSYCNAWKDGPNQVMPADMLARATQQALRLPWVRRVDFIWHGGETTLLPVEYFRNAIEQQATYRRDHIITNVIQTNATLLDDDWIALFKQGGFIVGVSLDPPPERHARNRKTKGGRDSWRASMEGIQRLRAGGIVHGALIVVTADLIEYGPDRFLACLDEHGLTDVALLNVLPDNISPSPGSGNYLDWSKFVQFLVDVYVEREKHYRGRIRIREIDHLAQNIKGRRPAICIFAGNCMGQFLTVEPSGEVSACDKYIGEKPYVFGTLATDSLEAILSGQQLADVRENYFEHRSALETCPYYHYCNGGCPHDQHLRRKLQPELTLRCCGLAPLIEVIQQNTSAPATGATSQTTAFSEPRVPT